jgi:glucuronosyltransferase
MNKISLLILFLAALNVANAFKVLAFLPFFATSHNKIGQSIAKSLANKGHEVTIVSCFPNNEENKNYREISTEDFLASFFKGI